MWEAIITAAGWALKLIGGLFQTTHDQDMKNMGATEVQKDETQKVLKKVIDADKQRDDVRNTNPGRLPDDPGNLYRD